MDTGQVGWCRFGIALHSMAWWMGWLGVSCSLVLFGLVLIWSSVYIEMGWVDIGWMVERIK